MKILYVASLLLHCVFIAGMFQCARLELGDWFGYFLWVCPIFFMKYLIVMLKLQEIQGNSRRFFFNSDRAITLLSIFIDVGYAILHATILLVVLCSYFELQGWLAYVILCGLTIHLSFSIYLTYYAVQYDFSHGRFMPIALYLGNNNRVKVDGKESNSNSNVIITAIALGIIVVTYMAAIGTFFLTCVTISSTKCREQAFEINHMETDHSCHPSAVGNCFAKIYAQVVCRNGEVFLKNQGK